MAPPFTEQELEILKGMYPSIAKNLGVSDTYVQLIAKGQREVKSRLAQRCLKKLQDTVVFFSPIQS